MKKIKKKTSVFEHIKRELEKIEFALKIKNDVLIDAVKNIESRKLEKTSADI